MADWSRYVSYYVPCMHVIVYTYTVIYRLTAMATSLIMHLHTQFSKLMIAVDICSYVAIYYGKG